MPGDAAAASGVDGPAPAWDGRPGPVSDSQWLPRTPWPHVSPFSTWTPACHQSRGLIRLVPVPSRVAIADGGGLPHAAPPFSAHPYLVRVFTLLPALREVTRLGSQQMGPGAASQSCHERGLLGEGTSGEPTSLLRTVTVLWAAAHKSVTVPAAAASPLLMASRKSIPSVVVSVPRSKNMLRTATTTKADTEKVLTKGRHCSQSFTRTLVGPHNSAFELSHHSPLAD